MEGAALSGKSALVIGASSGIGLATANLYADSGARVHAAARRTEAIQEGVGGPAPVDVAGRNHAAAEIAEARVQRHLDVLRIVGARRDFAIFRLHRGPE